MQMTCFTGQRGKKGKGYCLHSSLKIEWELSLKITLKKLRLIVDVFFTWNKLFELLLPFFVIVVVFIIRLSVFWKIIFILSFIYLSFLFDLHFCFGQLMTLCNSALTEALSALRDPICSSDLILSVNPSYFMAML